VLIPLKCGPGRYGLDNVIPFSIFAIKLPLSKLEPAHIVGKKYAYYAMY